MVVKVASKIGQAFSRSLASLSLADGSMLLRMRRASIALLALVGAVGLGLIVFISQLGWPGVVSGPLPGPPTQAGTVHNAIALSEAARGATAAGPAAVAAGRPARELSRRGAPGSPAGTRSQLAEGKKLAAAPGAGPGQGVGQPVTQPPSQAPGSEPVAPPAPTTAVVASPPQSSSAGQPTKAAANKTTEASVAKAVSDSNKSAATAATKSQGQKAASDKGSSSSSTSEAASAKAKRDESAAKAKAAPSPPAAVTPEKSVPASTSPAAAKEAADAANSN